MCRVLDKFPEVNPEWENTFAETPMRQINGRRWEWIEVESSNIKDPEIFTPMYVSSYLQDRDVTDQTNQEAEQDLLTLMQDCFILDSEF